MLKKSFWIILIIFFGCAMNNDKIGSFIVGKWASQTIESEWGPLTMKVIFTDKTFKVENVFSNQTKPITIDGSYRVEGNHIYADNWNKGQPIQVSIINKNLILKTNDEKPIILHRVKGAR